MQGWFRLVLGALAVWRVTHLLVYEDGPWDVVARLRRVAGSGGFGRLLDCFYCLSFWVAAPAALLISADWTERGLAWPALSGAAILLERMTEKKAAPVAVHYMEGDESEHELLRR